MIEGILIPILIGAVIVLQSGLNKKIGSDLSLMAATLTNNVVVFGLSLVVLIALTVFGHSNNFKQVTSQIFEHARWYYIIPGICGFIVVAGIPFAMTRLGAAQVFVTLVVAQMGFSLLWDVLVEGGTISRLHILGLCLATAGVFVLSYARSQ